MRNLKNRFASLIVLLLLSTKIVLAQSIPTLKTADSARDSITTLQYQVLALDAMLTICEQSHVDSLVAKGKQEAEHKKEVKREIRKQKNKGRKQGFAVGAIITIILFII